MNFARTIVRAALIPLATPVFAQAALPPAHAAFDLRAPGAGHGRDSTATVPAEAALAFHPETAAVSYRPFGTFAVGFRIGVGGIGGEIATPLGSHLALRGGVQAFSYSTTINTNGLTANGTLKLGDTFASVDCFPFRNGFHLSPGITLHNGNSLAATLNVPGGNTFTLNDVDYTSSPTDPITGTAALAFGKKVAPRLTVGWGNPFPKSGGHLSFPVELGFEYISYPKVSLALSGTGCTSGPNGGCGSIDTPDNQANINGQIAILDNDIAPARFFPIFSFGVDYRFGH